jgi:RHS repeat-associated protein
MLAGFGLLPLSAQETPPLLEAGKVQVTASAERSTLNRVTGVLTSAVDIEATNLSGQRIDGPVHAIIAFKTPEGVAVREAVTLPGALGGFGKDPWQQPFFDLTAQLGNDGWQPGTVLRLPLSFSRARTLSVLYEVSFAGRVNHEPVVNPGGPYTGRVGSDITFTGAATDPDGDPLTFAWDFGSGAGAPTAEASRAFATAGAPRVTLTVNDGRGGVVVRDVTVLVAPPGNFALGHTRIVDGTGHPLGRVQVAETGPLGSREFAAGDEGFVSLGLTAGNYGWTFSAPGHRPVHRQAALTDGGIKLLPSPWLAREGGPAEVSVLETTTLTAGNSAVRLTFPAGAFTQPGAARLTPLGPQTLPFPLPFGWSPMAAFYLDLPETPTLPAAARLKLAELVAVDEILTLVRFDETARVWRVIKTGQADPARRDEFNFSLGESGSVAVLVNDAGPGAPPIASIGDPLPAGTPQNLEGLVTAVGSVTPQEKPASLDPDAVTAVGEAIFTPATGLLPSGSWFRLGVQETYDLTDGTGLRTPDYDATMYAYRRPGPGGSTVRAAFPLRPRLLFGPAELKEAHLHVDVLPPLGDGPAALSEAGGSLGSGGFQVVIPPNALGGVAVGSLRSLGVSGFAGLAGPGFVVTGAFELNLAGLAPGTVLNFSMTTPVAPGADFILAKLVSFSGGSGLAPVQRLRSNAAGVLTDGEPDSPPRLPGLTGPGQYLLVQLPAAQGLVSGLVRTSAAVPVPGIGTRVTGQPWLSVTDTDGSYFLTFPAGNGTVLASNSANGDGAAAAFTMPAGLAAQTVDLTLGALAPRVLAVTPPDKALKIAVVTPLTVEFSEKIAPASLGATPLTLRAAGADNDVPASFTLDLANRIVTLLPANPLDPATEYTLTVSSAIRDLQNLALEGPREFTFTTAAPAARGIGAELTIYEPGAAGPTPADQALIDAIPGYTPGTDAGKVVAIGSAGSADAAVSVILVNQNTGATATVLSRPDGSFANFIEAGAEDFIEAVFVNANGSRVTVPATKQLFDNGRIGLYKYGGILEAGNEEAGQVQVIIEPDAIPNRTVFRLDLASVATLQQLLAANPPETGTVVGAFHYQVTEGEPPVKPPDVTFAATIQELGLQSGDNPDEHSFALCENAVEGGIPYYNIVDRMKYQGGRLVTSSPPFAGLASGAASSFLMVPVRMAFGYKFTAAGRVVLGRQSDLPPGSKITDQEAKNLTLAGRGPLIAVPGALVFGSVGGFTDVTNRLRPGAFASKANKNGFYATIVPYNPLDPDVVMVTSSHPSLPNLRATNGIVPDAQDSVALPVGKCNLVFAVPDNFVGDFSPPSIQAEAGQAVLPVGEEFVLRVRLEDNASEPVLRETVFEPVQSRADNPTTVLNGSSVLVDVMAERRTGKGQMEADVRVKAFEPLTAALKLLAADEAGNERVRVVLLRFGNMPPPEEDVDLVDEGDVSPPRLTGSIPGVGSLFTGTQISLFFNEPMSRLCLTPDAIGLRGAQIAQRRISNDQQTLILTLGQVVTPVRLNDELPVNGELALELNPSFFTDLAGNSLAGDNQLTYRTLPEHAVDLTGTAGAVAVTLAGNHIVTLRNDGNGGELVIHPPGALADTPPLGRLGLPVFPRAMVFMPGVTFFDPDKSPPPFTTLPAGANPLSLPGRVRTANLVAVTGGVTGEDQVGPWLWLVDVSDPAKPVRLASSLVTADFTSAASILKWSPPRLGVGLFTPDGGQVLMVNAQAFILGSKGYSANQSAFGLDLNFDADFVDPGERPPVPKSRTLFGLEDVAVAVDRLSFNDFAMMSGGSQLIGVTRASKTRPTQLHLLRWAGASLDPGEGVVELPPATYRVMLDPAFPLEDQTGVRSVPAAILVGGNRLLVVSLVDPERPVIVRSREVAPTGTTLFSLGETGGQELVVVGTDGLRTFSRAALGALGNLPFETALRSALSLGGGRSIGASEMELATYTAVTGTRVLRRSPKIGIIQLQDPPVPSIDQVRLLPDENKGRLLDRRGERGFLRPIFPRGEGAQSFVPADPAEHHFVLVRASGSFGASIRVGVQSLRESELANRVSKCSFLVTDRSPEIIHMTAHRMSDDDQTDLYNQYLAGPFVLVTQPLDGAQKTGIAALSGRQALWSGDFTSAFLASDPGADAELFPYLAAERGIVVETGLAGTYRSFRAEYQDSKNPSRGAAPRAMGGLVNLQSGELTVPETDVALEGRHQDVVFRRVYQSQSYYIGALGRNWDHNFNARIQEAPEGDFPESFSTTLLDRGIGVDRVRAADVVLIDGAGSTLLFRKISETNGNLAQLAGYENDPALDEFWGANGRSRVRTFYESPQSVFSFLVQLQDHRWVLIGVNGNRLYFNANGTLDRIVGERSASVLTCHYRPRDGMLGEVRGDNGSSLKFGYYYPVLDPRRTGPIDPIHAGAAACGKLARLQGQLSAGPGGPRVEFDYDSFGNLTSATPSWRRPVRYAYDEADPSLMLRFGEEDSGTYPEATISYVNGLVKTVTSGGEALEAGGSVKTAKQRFAAGNAAVSFGKVDGPKAEYGVDALGHPTQFGGRRLGVAQEGMVERFETLNDEVNLVHDSGNPVRRFRGNLLKTERRSIRGGAPRVSQTLHSEDAMNRPVRITDINGVVTDFHYLIGEIREVTGGRTKQTLINPFGQTTAVTWTGGPVPLQIQYPLDVVSGLSSGVLSNTQVGTERDDLGRVSTQTQGSGGFIHRFDPKTGRPSEIIARLPNEQPSLNWTYDADGRFDTESLTGGGRMVRHRYQFEDANLPGQATQVTVEETGLSPMVTESTFDDFGRVKTSTVDGIPSTMGYDGTILTSLDSPNFTRSLVLDEGARVKEQTQNGVTTAFEYDEAERLKTVRTGERKVTMEYEAAAEGRVTERVGRRTISVPDDPAVPAITEILGYDTGGKLKSINSSNGRNRNFEYHSDGSLHRALINGLVTRQIDMDQSGRVTNVTLGNLRRTIGTSDPEHGRPLNETLLWIDSGRSMSISHRYDASGRRLGTTYPAGEFAETYDVFGNITGKKDPDGVATGFSWSPLGVPLSATYVDGNRATYVTGAGRRPERTESAIGDQVMSYGTTPGVDGFGLLSAVARPDGTRSEFSLYNQFKKPEKVVNGLVEQALGYDAMGRLTSIASNFDNTNWSRRYDGLDRLDVSKLGGEEVEMLYNDFESIAGEVVRSQGVEIGRWTMERDALERTLAEVYPSGLRLAFAPDSYGQPTIVSGTGIDGIDWLGLGMPLEIRYASGMKTRWSYDENFRIKKVEYISPEGAVKGFSYEMTPGGRVLAETRLHEGRKDLFAHNTKQEGMRVGAVDFGLEVEPPQGQVAVPQAFVRGMDFINGELVSPQSTSAGNAAAGDIRGFFPTLARVQGSNRLATVDGLPVAYNERGSMESFPTWVKLPGANGFERVLVFVKWDAVGNLVRLQRNDGVTVTYLRDGLGRMATRQVTGPPARCVAGVTRYFWAGGRLLEERNGGQSGLPLIRRYHYMGGKLVLMEVPAGGNTELLVPMLGLTGSVGGYLNQGGELLHTIHYGLYGLPVVSAGSDRISAAAAASPLLFQGAFFDEATGLYEMGERHLHPLTGGFVERDTKLFAESLAWFTAFNGDPASRVDRSGTLSEEVDLLLKFKDQAEAAQALYEPSRQIAGGGFSKDSLMANGPGLVTAGFNLWLTDQDEDFRERMADVTEAAGQMKEGVELLQEYLGHFKGEEDDPESVFDTLKDPSEILLMDALSKDGMELALAKMSASSSAMAVKGGVAHAPEFTGEYDAGMDAQLKSYGRSKKLLALGQVALGLWGEEALGDKHKTKIATQVLSTLGKGIDFAEQLTMQRGPRALVNLRADPISALDTAFNLGFEIGKLGVVVFADDDVSDAYLNIVKQYEDDGGWLTVGSGILSTFGADDTAFLIQRIHDAEIDVVGSFQQVFENAMQERENRVNQTEYYLRALSAP